MGCHCDSQARALEADRSARRRRVLWSVLWINAVLFAGEFGAAIWADSSALLADSADNLGDMLTYGISLAVVGGALHQRARAAQVKGVIQLLFGLAILAEITRKLLLGFDPLPGLIVVAAAVALVGNLACLFLLTSQRNDDINMKSVWLCSRNDVIGNFAVILAAALIAATGAIWLDLVVGAALAALFLQTGASVLRQARRELATA
jgi:Co/Zn/Cd efflux system component